ncbi:MAG: TatD family nuclease-associated radical SAM protein [Christensenellales bacterium]|jgi:TatD family-associated radical SAM protein
MDKQDRYAYQIGESLYLNLTNACTNDCEFCVRAGSDGIAGYALWLQKEPDAKEVIAAMGDISPYKEIVFCGFGEPTMRLDVLKEVAAFIKERNKTVRLNTNGLANLYYGRDITEELVGLVDIVSISLNAPSAEEYEAVCHSRYGLSAFDALLDFARRCVRLLPQTILSVVDCMEAEKITRCREIAREAGAQFRVRAMIE